jgi:hypothetical protein
MRENVAFGLLSLANFSNMMLSSSIYLAAKDKISFFLAA